MAVRRHQLVSNIVDDEVILQIGRCLVVESLELWFETLDSEILMDAVVCFDPFRVGSSFHGDDFDLVAIIDITDHHIIVSLTGSNWEISCQVCVELTLIHHDCIQEVGLGAQVFVLWLLFLSWCL
jgi:hypothetical protein